MIFRPIRRRWHLIIGVSSILMLLGIYTAVAQYQQSKNPNDTTVPTWSQMGQGVARAFSAPAEGEPVRIFVDVKATYGRLALGLLMGVAIAVVLGMAMGCYEPIEAFFLPPLAFLAKIPPTAMLAVFFVLVGTQIEFYIAMIAFGTAPTLAQAVYQAARKDVPEELVYKARTLGASEPEVIWNIVFRQVLPRVIEATRLQIGPAMVYLVAAEYVVGGGVGFGNRIRVEQRVLNFNLIYFYLTVLGASGLLIDYTLSTLRQKMCPWFGQS